MLTDEDGFITEGTSYNFMIVREGELISPEPRNMSLRVTRVAVFDLAFELDMPFPEVFFCSPPFVTMPVGRADRHPLTDAAPGPLTAKLMEASENLVGVDFVAQGRRSAAAGASRRTAVA